MGKPITDDDRKAIYILANNGMLYKDIARMMERPIGTIHTVISKGILDGMVERRIERENKRKD